MSDKFEKFVKQHRDEFDLLEPNAKLWEKIDTRLGSKNKTRNLSILWKAAAILLIFGFSFWAQMQMDQTPQTVSRHNIQSNHPEIASSPKSEEEPVIARQMNKVMPEFTETESYYNRKVNSTLNELKVYLVKYPEVANDMKKDISELDSVYHVLKRDLGDNVAQEEILDAMIQNYRMKLQILEDIKNELIQNNPIKSSPKNNSHEI